MIGHVVWINRRSGVVHYHSSCPSLNETWPGMLRKETFDPSRPRADHEDSLHDAQPTASAASVGFACRPRSSPGCGLRGMASGRSHPRSSTSRPLAPAAVPSSTDLRLVGEVVGVDPLHLICLALAHPNVVVDHQRGEALSVNKHHAWRHAGGILLRVASEGRCGENDALGRPSPLKRADEALDHWAAYGRLPLLRLDVDGVEPKSVFANHAVDSGVSACACP